MKSIHVLIAMTLIGCNANTPKNETVTTTDTMSVDRHEAHSTDTLLQAAPSPTGKMYSNERFKEVIVEKTGDHQFLIRGKGQIFEASFSWVVEDGHEELQKGYQMTDAGAPEWGKFSFTVDVAKKRENSTLMLILFESSPKDGSRQYELPVFLY